MFRQAANDVEAFSIHRWLALEAGPHVGLHGSAPSKLAAADEVLSNEILRLETIRYTVQLLVAERCALAATAGLINTTASELHKRFLASQALDEARHMEAFTHRLFALGVEPEALETTVLRHAHPDLIGLSEVVLRPMEKGDFLSGFVAQGLVLDEIVTATYELLAVLVGPLEPEFAAVLDGIIRDERRHTGFAEFVVQELLTRHPDRKVALDHMQRAITSLMLKTFHEAFRDNPMVDELGKTLAARNGGRKLSWQGIDPLAGDGRAESTLARLIGLRIRERFRRVGITYRAPAHT